MHCAIAYVFGDIACFDTAPGAPPAMSGPFVEVSAGEVTCWVDPAYLTEPAGTGWVQLATGAGFFCALNTAGEVSCWGDESLDVFGVLDPNPYSP